MSKRYVTSESGVRFASALRAIVKRGYNGGDFKADAIAGVILGLVALPLSMALAIAAGAPPEYGLFTAIVAGIVMAIFWAAVIAALVVAAIWAFRRI